MARPRTTNNLIALAQLNTLERLAGRRETRSASTRGARARFARLDAELDREDRRIRRQIRRLES